MFRIDVPSAVPALPAPQAAGTPGFFGRGDFSGGTPPTTVTADWANMLQEEITGVIEHAAISPSKTDHTQLLAALNALYLGVGAITGLIANPGYIILPLGLIVQWGTGSTSSGVLPITFPLAFPNSVFSIQATVVNASPSTGAWAVVEVGASPTVAGFNAYSATFGTASNAAANGTVAFNWVAFGK